MGTLLKTQHMHYKKYFYPAGKLNRLKDMLSTIFRELFVSPHNQRQELLFPMFLPYNFLTFNKANKMLLGFYGKYFENLQWEGQKY